MKGKFEYKQITEVASIDYGTRVVRKRDGGTIYPVYGGGGATFKMDSYNRENCLVVARFAMSEQCTRFVSGKFFLNDSGLTVSTTNSNLLQEYLDWFLICKNDYIFSLGKGFAQKNLCMEEFRKIMIPIPSLAQQRIIVNLLDKEFAKIDKFKENAEKNIQNVKRLFQSFLKDELENKDGFETYSLNELSTIKGEYGLSVSSKPFDGIRYVRITDITEDGKLNVEKVSANITQIDKHYLLKEGDVLFARTGASVGKTYIHDEKYGQCVFAGYLIRFRLNPDLIIPEYLMMITHSDRYYNWVKLNQRAAAQPNINSKKYGSLKISFPNIIEQKSIVKRLLNIEINCIKIQEANEKIIKLCNDLKQSLLQKAFNGEL